MGTVARMVELEAGAPCEHFGAEADEGLEQLLEAHQLRAAAVERQGVDAETRLQRREAVELVEHHVGHGVALQVDDQPHAIPVAFVADLGDALDLLVAHHLGDALVQPGLVLLVWNLGDDDRLAAAGFLLDVGLGPHHHRAAAELESGPDAVAAEDDAAGREIRTRHVFHELRHGQLGIGDQRQAGFDQLAEIVRRDVGRHAHRDAAGAVGQQVRIGRRQHRRLALALVVVRLELDSVLVDVLEQRLRDRGETRLGVTHRRRRIAVHRAEIALPRDQRQAHREVLRHAHHGVVDRAVAVRVILAHHVADDAGRLAEGPRRVVAAFLHRVEDAPLHGLQPVARVGQRARDDHAHGVIEVGAAHLLFDGDRGDIVRRRRGRRRVRGRRHRRQGRIVAHGNLGIFLVLAARPEAPSGVFRKLANKPRKTNKNRPRKPPLTL